MASGYPWWLKHANRVILFLNRLGVPVGPPHVLTVPGRSSGTPRSTPVSIVTVNGDRYLVGAPGASWVRNVRAAGRGEIRRGRRREEFALTELPPADRAPILHAYWSQHPQGRPIAARLFGLAPTATAAEFEAAAPRCPVFRCILSDDTGRAR